MLSIKRIEKLTESGHFGQLVDEVAANGRPIQKPLRNRLNEPGTLKPAAIGLGIRRITEISFTVSPTTRKLLNHLLNYQQGDGSFGSLPATAIALRALIAVKSQAGSISLQPKLDNAITAAAAFLRDWQNHNADRADILDENICRLQLADLTGILSPNDSSALTNNAA